MFFYFQMASSSIIGHNLWTIAKFVISINDLDKNAKDVAFEKINHE
jgi:hypothetical protein